MSKLGGVPVSDEWISDGALMVRKLLDAKRGEEAADLARWIEIKAGSPLTPDEKRERTNRMQNARLQRGCSVCGLTRVSPARPWCAKHAPRFREAA